MTNGQTGLRGVFPSAQCMCSPTKRTVAEKLTVSEIATTPADRKHLRRHPAQALCSGPETEHPDGRTGGDQGESHAQADGESGPMLGEGPVARPGKSHAEV